MTCRPISTRLLCHRDWQCISGGCSYFCIFRKKVALKDELVNYSVRRVDDNMWAANFGRVLRSADICKWRPWIGVWESESLGVWVEERLGRGCRCAICVWGHRRTTTTSRRQRADQASPAAPSRLDNNPDSYNADRIYDDLAPSPGRPPVASSLPTGSVTFSVGTQDVAARYNRLSSIAGSSVTL